MDTSERDRWKAEVDRALREREAIAESHHEWQERARNAEAEMQGMERGREALLAERDRYRRQVEAVRALTDKALADRGSGWGDGMNTMPAVVGAASILRALDGAES